MIWNDAKVAAFDFETSGSLPEYALQPWRLAKGDFWATSMSIIIHEGRLVQCGSTLRPTVEQMRYFLTQAIANDWTVVGWNLVFDIGVLLAYGLRDLVFKVKWLDGMLLWKHLSIEPEYDMNRGQKKSYRLKPDAIKEFLPTMAGYEDDVNFHSTDPVELAKLQKYNDRDSVCTWLISKMLWHRLTPEQQNAALIEASCLPLVAEANLNGMVVDTLIANELSANLVDTAAAMLEKLKEHGVTEKVVRSPKQLSELMFDQWKLPVLKESAAGNRSTDKETLHELAFMDPRCADLRSYREALNCRTKFAQAPLLSAEYNGDGRTRPSGIVFGTYTGRLTYASKQGKNKDERPTGFALHQEKRGSKFRSIIGAPPGYTLVEFDAKGQEFRWMAIMSNDPTMLQLCLPGEDMHSFMGAQISGSDYRYIQQAAKVEGSSAEQTRYLGKFGNLSCQYRIGGKTLRSKARVDYEIPLELPEAQRIIRTFNGSYSQVPRYWDRAIQKVKQLGYAETLAGRRIQVIGDWGGSLSWKMESTALNYPIQGTGGDQKYLALQILRDYLLAVGGYFAWDMHDGIYLYIPDNMVDRVAAEGKAMLNALPYREAWGYTPPIPLPWDCKVGKLWGTLKEYEGG